MLSRKSAAHTLDWSTNQIKIGNALNRCCEFQLFPLNQCCSEKTPNSFSDSIVHQRHFRCRPGTSGLPLQADICSAPSPMLRVLAPTADMVRHPAAQFFRARAFAASPSDPSLVFRRMPALCVNRIARQWIICWQRKPKAAPVSLPAAAQMRPWWASTTDRQMDRPIPIPCDLVVNIGWKIFSRSDGEIPGPDRRSKPAPGLARCVRTL